MKIETESVVSRVVAGIITIISAIFLNWLFLPAWNIRSGGFWCYCIIVCVIATITFSIADLAVDYGTTTIITNVLKIISIAIYFLHHQQCLMQLDILI